MVQRHVATLFTLLILCILLSTAGTFDPPIQAQTDERCFTATGHCISGSIRAYWEQQGGLAVFGLPITPPQVETVEGSWQGTVQWFERDRLEDHGEQGILAGRLGADILDRQGTPWTTFPTVEQAPPGCTYFDVTRHSLCEPFLSYWQNNGGLERFGYPITEPFQMTIIGWTGTVQYFERRRMEHHDELSGTQYEVLLGRLGEEIRSIPTSATPSPFPSPSPSPSQHPSPSPSQPQPTKSPVATATPQPDSPPTSTPIVEASQAHPRLLFTPAMIDTLQRKAASSHQAIWAPIKDFADTEASLQFPRNPPDNDFEAYRLYGDQVIAFAFACAISEQPNHCNLATRALLTYASWDRWDEGETRDLGLAHMLMGNAIAYDIMYARLSADERETIRTSLATQAQKMYEASINNTRDDWNNWWGSAFMQNHNWVNHSGLGMAGLALLGEDDRAELWVNHARERLLHVQYLLNGIEDGTWHESIPYQEYGLNMLLAFLNSVHRVENVDQLPHTYLQNYASWRIYNYLPGTTDFLMSYGDFEWDWLNGALSLRLLRFIAAEYQDGYAEWLAQQIEATTRRSPTGWEVPWYVFEFLAYDPDVAPRAPDNLARSRVFKDLTAVIWRTGWGIHDIAFGFKAGVYGGRYGFDTFTRNENPWDRHCLDAGCALNIGHDHLDTNTFYLTRGNQWLVPESVGVDLSATSFHNTLRIDDRDQYRPPEDHYGQYPEDFRGSDGFLETSASTPEFDYLAADATRRYKHRAGIRDVTRSVLFVRPDYFIMLDSITSDARHRYDWICHVDNDVQVDGTWIRGETSSDAILGIQVIAPESFDTVINEDKNDRTSIIIRPSSDQSDVRLLHMLYPTDRDMWYKRPQARLIDDNGEAVELRVDHEAQGTGWDDIMLTYAEPTVATALSSYAYDGRVAVVRYDHDGMISRLFLIGGTFLMDLSHDRELVKDVSSSTVLEVVYNRSDVTVSGHLPSQISLYAPHAQTLTVNGKQRSFSRSGDMIHFEP